MKPMHIPFEKSGPGRAVIFCTPCLSHQVSLEFLRSSLETSWLLMQYGIGVGYKQVGGDCFIAKARNKLVTEFLEEFPTATDLFFLDDDLGWPAHKVLEFLARPEDVVAGIYPKKQDTLDYPVEVCVDPVTGTLIERNGLVKALGVPTGFLRIKRHVLEKMAGAADRCKELQPDGSVKLLYNIFETHVDADGWFAGEDYVFCRKWRAMGGEIWVDPSVPFTHRGQKKWSATLTESLPTFRERALQMKQEAA